MTVAQTTWLPWRWWKWSEVVVVRVWLQAEGGTSKVCIGWIAGGT